jgi:hypothetical protein
MPNNKFVASIALAVVLGAVGCGQSASSPESTTNPTDQSTSTATAKEAVPAPAAPKSKPVVVPAGTSVAVTVDEAVSSKTNGTGDRFAASLSEPIVVGNTVAIPKGAKVSGTVTDAKSAGRFKGNAELGLTLSSVTVSGKRYNLTTSTYSESSGSRGKRTALGTGLGAAAGAAIGAIAGGGKGAAIGAGAGAGAGVAGSALTGERDVEVAPETRIEFKLSQPVTVEVPMS